MVLFWGNMEIWGKAFCALLLIYGLRLGSRHLRRRGIFHRPFRRHSRNQGEILLWTGVFLSGFTALEGFWQWFFAVWGYVLILWVMFSGARRLELRQNKNYGDRPEYQEYVAKVPIILPLVPLYSVVKYKWLMA